MPNKQTKCLATPSKTCRNLDRSSASSSRLRLRSVNMCSTQESLTVPIQLLSVVFPSTNTTSCCPTFSTAQQSCRERRCSRALSPCSKFSESCTDSPMPFLPNRRGHAEQHRIGKADVVSLAHEPRNYCCITRAANLTRRRLLFSARRTKLDNLRQSSD